MEWAQQRKIVYALSFAVIIILLAAYPVYTLVKQTPTCFDNKQNGDETGVDCGGGCARVCEADVSAPRVVWAKAFSLGNNQYDIGAYVENINKDAGLKNMRYTFHIFDNNGQIIAEKSGATELTPSSIALLFETGTTLTDIPGRVDVVFNPDDLTQWTKAKNSDSVVLTKNQNLTNVDTKPRFDAVLVNTDPVNDVTSLTVGGIIYDVSRNPVAISRTYVDTIPKNGEKNIFFTWPQAFTSSSTQVGFITELVVNQQASFAN